MGILVVNMAVMGNKYDLKGIAAIDYPFSPFFLPFASHSHSPAPTVYLSPVPYFTAISIRCRLRRRDAFSRSSSRGKRETTMGDLMGRGSKGGADCMGVGSDRIWTRVRLFHWNHKLKYSMMSISNKGQS